MGWAEREAFWKGLRRDCGAYLIFALPDCFSRALDVGFAWRDKAEDGDSMKRPRAWTVVALSIAIVVAVLLAGLLRPVSPRESLLDRDGEAVVEALGSPTKRFTARQFDELQTTMAAEGWPLSVERVVPEGPVWMYKEKRGRSLALFFDSHGRVRRIVTVHWP